MQQRTMRDNRRSIRIDHINVIDLPSINTIFFRVVQ